MIDKIQAYQFNWGSTTAEAHNSNLREVIFLFNFALNDDKKIENVKQLVIGRICFGSFNFPRDYTIKITFDIRGQEIIPKLSRKVKEDILDAIYKLELKNNIEIDFIR